MAWTRVRSWLGRYGRYGVGVGALAWLFSRMDWGATVSFLGGVSASTVAALVVVSVIGQLGVFLSWHALLRQFDASRFIDAASVSLSLAFFNLSLPSRIPSTVLNPFLIVDNTDLNGGEATAITVAQMTLFSGCYGVVTVLGLVSGLDRFPGALTLVLAISAAIYLGVLATGLLVTSGLGSVSGRLRGLPVVDGLFERAFGGDTTFSAEVQSAFATCLRDPPLIAVYVLGWTGGLMLASGLRIWLLFRAADVLFTPLLLLPVFSVTAYAITILPISVGGIGVAELSATLVFTSLGVPIDIAAPVVLVDRFFGGYLPGVVGVYPAVKTDVSSLRGG